MEETVTLLVDVDGEVLEVVVTGPAMAVKAVVDSLVETDTAKVDEAETDPVEEAE